MTSIPLGTRIRQDLLERLKECSRRTGRSIRWLVEQGVEFALKEYESEGSEEKEPS